MGGVFLNLTFPSGEFPPLGLVVADIDVFCQMTVEAFAKIEYLVPRERQQQLLRILDTRIADTIGSGPSDALKFSNDLTPSLDVVLFYESAKKMKQTYAGRFWAVVIDLRVCASVASRERRKYSFSQAAPF